nr:Rab3 GTPase-activating protein catalytic subunit isoform X1 [Tanacetum cinerariifolium]
MPHHSVTFAGSESLNGKRRGSAGVVESMMLLKSRDCMHAPFTQDPPIMTEDMHEERLRAVEVLGDSFNFSGQLEKDILASDMSAFKAANPDAVFEDFIRWHSPKDWEEEDDSPSSRKKWPPGGRLSERMSDPGNSWRKIWHDAPSLPASEQKPLMDPNREGEKILHYLETVRPHQLLEQMVCGAFRAAADTLNQTSFGGLKNMTTKIDQLYLTLASALRPLQANKLPGDIEIIEDLKRLCVVFEHVEKLITLAASLHRKFLHAPRLAQMIFNDFYNFYVPKMGNGSVEGGANKEAKKEVKLNERDVVTNMFVQPSASQSWRKVLSMGNLLNGHEPILREIIFSLRDRVDSSYHAPGNRNPWSHELEIETHRMYICVGTPEPVPDLSRFNRPGQSRNVDTIETFYHGTSLGGPDIYQNYRVHGVWSKIAGSINSLHNKKIITFSALMKQVNNGKSTKFWNDIWLCDTPLKHKFPHLYRMDIYPDCTAHDTWNSDWIRTWSRSINGGVPKAQLDDLSSLLGNSFLTDKDDSWIWSLENSIAFNVKDTRNLIDDLTLPDSFTPTRRCRFISKKVNILIWRILRDRVPTRWSLSRKVV